MSIDNTARDTDPLISGPTSDTAGSEDINQETLQENLAKVWGSLTPEEQGEIAAAFGVSVTECSSLIRARDFGALFRNIGPRRRFLRTFAQALKLLVSFLAAGGGFKTGNVTAGILKGVGSGLSPAETTMLNAAGGTALMTFFATGDYSKTGEFLGNEWKKSGVRTAAYLLLLVLNASLSGFFAYTGAAGTMNVFGFVLNNVLEEESIGGVLAISNFFANLALTGGAAQKHQNRKADIKCVGNISLVYLVSMLMYIAGPFQANLGGINDQQPSVKASAALLTFVSIFYSAVVMLSVLDDPRKVYKDQMMATLDYIRSCNGLATKALTGTYFLIMFGLIFTAMTFLFAANNISAVMWGINDISQYIPQHSNYPTVNGTNSSQVDFSEMGPDTIGLIVYSVICVLSTAFMVGAITLSGIRDLLRGFEPYGLSQMMQTKIMLKAASINNDAENNAAEA